MQNGKRKVWGGKYLRIYTPENGNSKHSKHSKHSNIINRRNGRKETINPIEATYSHFPPALIKKRVFFIKFHFPIFYYQCIVFLPRTPLLHNQTLVNITIAIPHLLFDNLPTILHLFLFNFHWEIQFHILV